jgi:hypothetical protein
MRSRVGNELQPGRLDAGVRPNFRALALANDNAKIFKCAFTLLSSSVATTENCWNYKNSLHAAPKIQISFSMKGDVENETLNKEVDEFTASPTH